MNLDNPVDLAEKLALSSASRGAKMAANCAKHSIALSFATAKLLNENAKQIKNPGRENLKKLLKSSEVLTEFSLKKQDYAAFSREAKSYGVVYAIRKSDHGASAQIVAPAKDAAKINRIMARFSLIDYEKPKPKIKPKTL